MTRDSDNRICLKIVGRIDALNYDLFEEKLNTLKRMGFTDVVLDFKNVSFVNISALILLIRLSNELNRKRPALVILNADPKIQKNLNDLGSKYLRWNIQ